MKLLNAIADFFISPPKELPRWSHIIMMVLQAVGALSNIIWLAVLYQQNILTKMAVFYFGINTLLLGFAFVVYLFVYKRRYSKKN